MGTLTTILLISLAWFTYRWWTDDGEVLEAEIDASDD
jgi:hypothetical protein